MSEMEQKLIIDEAKGYPGGESRIRILVESSIGRFYSQALQDPKLLKSEVFMFNGLPLRGKSTTIEETQEAIDTDERINKLRRLGFEIPISPIKIENGLALAKPQTPIDPTKQLEHKSGNYGPAEYAAGSKEMTDLLVEALKRPGFYLAEAVGFLGYQDQTNHTIVGWDIGCSTTWDLVKKHPPFEDNYNLSVIALDADDLVVARGKLYRIHKAIGDIAEIGPTLGLYSRGDNLGGGVLASVNQAELLLQDTLRAAATAGLIPDSPFKDKKIRDFFNFYYTNKLALNLPPQQLCMTRVLWLGKPIYDEILDNAA